MKSLQTRSIAFLTVVLLPTILLAQGFTFSVTTAVDPSYEVNFPAPSNGETVSDFPVKGASPDDPRVTFQGVGFAEVLPGATLTAGYLDYTSTTGTVVIDLDKSLRGSFAAMKLSPVDGSFGNATLGGLSAREAYATTDDQIAYGRFAYIATQAGDREYCIFTLFDKSANHTKAEADAFFNSFRPATTTSKN